MAQILIYHALDSETQPVSITDAADLSVVVREENFRKQLQWLKDNKRQVVSLEELLREDPPQPAADQVVLTFDDGHLSNYSMALPLLKEFGYTATFYIVSGFVNNDPEYITTTQLQEMAAAGMHIGAHSVTHQWLPLLSKDEVRRELADSRKQLEEMIDAPVVDFALPGGHFNTWMLDAARDAGYRSVATSKAGLFQPDTNLMRLPRVEIRRGLSNGDFGDKFEPKTLARLRLAETLKTCLRRSCGLSRYLKLRQLAHRCLKPNR